MNAATKSDRWFCPACKRERTGDVLTAPCACLRERAERRRRAEERRSERAGGDIFRKLVVVEAIA